MEFSGALASELLAPLGLSAPDADFAKLAHVGYGFKLRARLKTAADYPCYAGIGPREVFRSDTACRAGANLPEVVGFEGSQREPVRRPVEQNLEMRAGFCIHGIGLQAEVLRHPGRHVVKNRTGGQND